MSTDTATTTTTTTDDEGGGPASARGCVTDDAVEPRLVTLADAADRAGVTRRQLAHWIDREWLPVAEPHPGSGAPVVLTRREASIARLAGALVSLGLRPEPACLVAQQLETTASEGGDGVARLGAFRVTLAGDPRVSRGITAP